MSKFFSKKIALALKKTSSSFLAGKFSWLKNIALLKEKTKSFGGENCP